MNVLLYTTKKLQKKNIKNILNNIKNIIIVINVIIVMVAKIVLDVITVQIVKIVQIVQTKIINQIFQILIFDKTKLFFSKNIKITKPEKLILFKSNIKENR